MKILRGLVIVLMLIAAGAVLALGSREEKRAPAAFTKIQYWEKWTGEEGRQMRQIVDEFNNTVGREKRIFVDALEYRKGKDIELRKMAKFLAQKARDSGIDQQLGPLNPYERRIVHMAVAEVPGVTTESIGDAFSKTVLIQLRK